jgi:hypothetical protein
VGEAISNSSRLETLRNIDTVPDQLFVEWIRETLYCSFREVLMCGPFKLLLGDKIERAGSDLFRKDLVPLKPSCFKPLHGIKQKRFIAVGMEVIQPTRQGVSDITITLDIVQTHTIAK